MTATMIALDPSTTTTTTTTAANASASDGSVDHRNTLRKIYQRYQTFSNILVIVLLCFVAITVAYAIARHFLPEDKIAVPVVETTTPGTMKEGILVKNRRRPTVEEEEITTTATPTPVVTVDDKISTKGNSINSDPTLEKITTTAVTAYITATAAVTVDDKLP